VIKPGHNLITQTFSSQLPQLVDAQTESAQPSSNFRPLRVSKCPRVLGAFFEDCRPRMRVYVKMGICVCAARDFPWDSPNGGLGSRNRQSDMSPL
jgi:hypothetical protein